MKRVLAGMLLAVLVLVGAATHTAQAATEVTFTGVVRYQGHPIPNIEVQVECWETGFNKRIITDANGVYRATATETECPYRTPLKVRAETANNTIGYVGARMSELIANNILDIDTVPKGVVPEFGRMGGVFVASAGVGIVAWVRRRSAQDGSSL